MSGIKYYQLTKGEELPDEFCAVRDIDGEPSEYTFYVPEAENVKLRELVKHVISRYNDMNREYWGNQEPLPCDLCNMERQCSEVPQHDRCLFYEYLRELGVEVD